MDEFDQFRELSDKNLEKLRGMAATNPSLQKTLQMYEQISGRSLSEAARKAQDESDSRWERMEADLAKLSPTDQQPKTMGALSAFLSRYGFKPPTPVPADELDKQGSFADFMAVYGSHGLDLVADPEMKNASESQQQQQQRPKCEQCGEAAAMKCTQCGEHYCSRECQKKAWPAHKPVCKLVASRGL